MFDDFDDEEINQTDPLSPLRMPSLPPQLEWEQTASVMELIDSAPKWDPAFAIELVHLVRNHIALRSMLGFGLELARQHELNFRVQDDEKEMFRSQGAIRALTQHFETLTSNIRDAEDYKRKQEDDLET